MHLQKIKELLNIFAWRWRTRHIEKTTKSRTELRHQYTEFNGKDILVIDYIRIVARLMPQLYDKGFPVDNNKMLREIYYKYDYKGLKHYIKKLNGNFSTSRNSMFAERKRKRALKLALNNN